MKPINVNAFDMIGDMAATALIAFGAATMRSAAGTLKAPVCSDNAQLDNILGIANWDEVEKTVNGFYSQYDIVPIIPAGRVRVLVTSNESDKEDIEAGDYFELAMLGGTNTLPVGVFQQMGAETGTCTGAVRELLSLARAVEDVTLTDIEPVSVSLAVGGTVVTLLAADITNLALVVGDYILLEDIDGNAMINIVKELSTTTITLGVASTVALTSGDNDPVHKLHQAEVLLL